MRPSEPIVVNARPVETPASGGFAIQDIYYALFRHKWKIILLSLIGFGVGAGLYVTADPEYVSEAKLLVRYVVENREIINSDGPSVRNPDARGSSVMNTEINILTSFDLAREVVEVIGASNIVRNPEIADPTAAALGAVRRGVIVSNPRRSNVLSVGFRHADREVSRMVLTNLVATYLKFHTRVHRALDVLDEVDREVQIRRGALERTEADLRRLRSELDLSGISLDESRRTLFEQVNRIRTEIMTTEAVLSERRAGLGAPQEDSISPTNTLATASATTLPEGPPPEKIAEYRNLRNRMIALTKREQDLLMQFTSESVFVKAVRDLLQEAEQNRRRMEEAFPALLASAPSTDSTEAPAANPMAAIAALESKLRILNAQLAQLRAEGARITDREAEFVELQRKQSLEQTRYVEFASRLDRAKLDETLSQDKIGNIRVLQGATPASPVYDIQQKVAMGFAGGGIALGILLAFLAELLTDQSVRRPQQVEKSLRVPLFLSIPQLNLNGRAARRRLRAARRQVRAALQAPPGTAPDPASAANPELALALRTEALGDTAEMAPFAEALRDRLMMYFQLHGLNHKPKLVGVTSCGHGAGVSSLATSLASSLSETGDGNVLYVDVNPQRGPSVQPYHRGKLGIGIRDALEEETRDSAKVHDNLYMVSMNDPATGKVGIIPKTLASLVPKMKASDYDYIIFDLPPVTQTSATAKVAGLLDMTFMVLESEKTQCELARKATTLLAESRANIAAVLNKHRRYLPRSMDTDL